MIMEVEILVEGYTDELFVRKCFELLQIPLGTVYGKRGSTYIVEKASGFAIRGNYSPILILADLMDMPAPCAPAARQLLAADLPEHALLRFAVPEIESWLIASRSELAGFLGISEGLIPEIPDGVEDPKRTLVNLARRSPRRKIRDMFVPRGGSTAVVGAGYVDGFAQFLSLHWQLESAKNASPSFSRFVERTTQCFLSLQNA